MPLILRACASDWLGEASGSLPIHRKPYKYVAIKLPPVFFFRDPGWLARLARQVRGRPAAARAAPAGGGSPRDAQAALGGQVVAARLGGGAGGPAAAGGACAPARQERAHRRAAAGRARVSQSRLRARPTAAAWVGRGTASSRRVRRAWRVREGEHWV